MTYAVAIFTTATASCSAFIPRPFSCRRPTLRRSCRSSSALLIHCSTSISEAIPEKIVTVDGFPLTGGAYDFSQARLSLTNEPISTSKTVTLIRHGLSTWNAESRIQGSSDLSVLTEIGEKQAERCKKALQNIHFDTCFSSPISRAKQTAEIMWQGKEESLVYLDSLKELCLYHLEGVTNGSGC